VLLIIIMIIIKVNRISVLVHLQMISDV